MILVERVSTGVPGLDELLEGGYVKGSTNLIAGTAGTGKTTFCCQFLWDGLQKGETGVYISLEQKPEEIMQDMLRYGMDFKRYVRVNKFIIDYFAPGDVSELSAVIFNAIKRINASRFVLDSLSLAAMGWKERPEEAFKLRIKIFDLLKTLKSLGVTSLLISEVPRAEKESLSRFGFEEFVVDGVILLQFFTVGGPIRSLHIIKMRRTKHGTKIYPFEITERGIVVKSR